MRIHHKKISKVLEYTPYKHKKAQVILYTCHQADLTIGKRIYLPKHLWMSAMIHAKEKYIDPILEWTKVGLINGL